MSFSDHPIVLFDGVCNFCNGAVNFLIRQDQKGLVRFAALQSNAGRQLLQQHKLPTEGFQSFVLIEGGKVYQKSGAALRLLPYMPWYWQWGRIGWLLPSFLRNAAYDFIARNRYRWFGKKEACMIPDASVRQRFL